LAFSGCEPFPERCHSEYRFDAVLKKGLITTSNDLMLGGHIPWYDY
jgi:hypothetical protein